MIESPLSEQFLAVFQDADGNLKYDFKSGGEGHLEGTFPLGDDSSLSVEIGASGYGDPYILATRVNEAQKTRVTAHIESLGWLMFGDGTVDVVLEPDDDGLEVTIGGDEIEGGLYAVSDDPTKHVTIAKWVVHAAGSGNDDPGKYGEPKTIGEEMAAPVRELVKLALSHARQVTDAAPVSPALQRVETQQATS